MILGFAQQCITPKLPIRLSGYLADRTAEAALDNLYVKALICRHHQETYGILVYDLIAVDGLLIEEMKPALKQLHIKPENILFTATHTHSGPGGVIETTEGLLKPSADVFLKTDPALIAYLAQKSSQALKEALGNCQETALSYAKSTLTDVGDNRNSRSLKGNPDILAVFLEQKNGARAVMLHYACHPTVLNSGNNKLSADFPGAVAACIEQRGYAMCMYLNGSCGDISTRFSRWESTADELVRYARIFEEKLTEMKSHAKQTEIRDFAILRKVCRLNLKQAGSIEQAKEALDACESRLAKAIRDGVSGSELRIIRSYLEGAQSSLALAQNPYPMRVYDISVTFVKINRHIFVCVPGELFSELSNPLQNEQVHFIGYTNGYVGYFADESAYDNFYYEALSSPFEKGEGEKLMKFIEQAISDIAGKEKNNDNRKAIPYVRCRNFTENNRRTGGRNRNQAAELVCQSCLNGGRFYVFGSGHSHMIAEELYIRAGGLAYVKAILPPELMLHEMPNKSTWLERLSGYAEAMLKLHKVDEKDTILIISNSGRNIVPVEMALESRKLGAKVIAMTSLQHSTQTTSRHASGKKLYELADVVLDNGAPKGDAGFFIEGLDTPTGPTSDTIGIALAQALIASAIDKLVRSGHQPPVFKSSNVDGADDYNNELFDTYYGYWK